MRTVRIDDLNYDGENIIIPAYWSGMLYDILKAVEDKNYKLEWNPNDKVDFNTLLKFAEEVNFIDTDHDGN